MKQRNSKKLVLVGLFALLMSGPAIAEKKTADTATGNKATKSDRKAESEMYQKMADCLKSNRSYETCHGEMAESSQRMGLGQRMGKMRGMNRGKMGPGMMNRGMKDNAPSDMEGMEQREPAE